MPENPYETSMECRLLSSTPMERVVLLYDAAISTVQDARTALAQGRIVERSRAVSLAVEILSELSQSLDHRADGKLSTRLASLYDYMQRALLDANFHQTDGGLAETEGLLRTLREAWAQAALTLDAAGVAGRSTPVEPIPADLPWPAAAAPERVSAHNWTA